MGVALLVTAFLLGPLAWFLDMQISYAMVKWACEHDRRVVLLLIPVASLAVIAAGSWMSWSSFAQLRDTADAAGAEMTDRRYFIAVAGLAMNAVFALLILTSIFPRYFLSPCE